ncbi:MAG: hypothetical protein ACXVAN_17045 [Polyangia bacterium]
MLTGLVRFLISLVMLAAFVWFAVTVPLGKRTLWGHVHAIFATQEAKDLAEGTKEEAERVARKVKEELHPQDMARPAPPPTPAPAPRHVKTPLP